MMSSSVSELGETTPRHEQQTEKKINSCRLIYLKFKRLAKHPMKTGGHNGSKVVTITTKIRAVVRT